MLNAEENLAYDRFELIVRRLRAGDDIRAEIAAEFHLDPNDDVRHYLCICYMNMNDVLMEAQYREFGRAPA